MIIHKPSLGPLEIPHKIWAWSVQPFLRLLDTNRQANFIYRRWFHSLNALQFTGNVVNLAQIDRILIWRHSRLYNQWRHMQILSIYAKERKFSVHWSASRVSNLIIQPYSLYRNQLILSIIKHYCIYINVRGFFHKQFFHSSVKTCILFFLNHFDNNLCQHRLITHLISPFL